MQDPAPSREYVPAVQSRHVDATASEKVPALHMLQAGASTPENCPVEHVRHALAPVSEYSPARHDPHVVFCKLSRRQFHPKLLGSSWRYPLECQPSLPSRIAW